MLYEGNVKSAGFRELNPIEIEVVSGGFDLIGGMLHKDADPWAAAAGNPDALAVFGGSNPFGFGDGIAHGINPWIRDSWENAFYGRNSLPGGEAYTQDRGVYTLWDPKGNKIGEFVETTQDQATRVITNTSGGGSIDVGPFTGTAGTASITIYLKPR